MTRLVRRATLLTTGALCVAGVAMAGTPSGTNSTQAPGITLVGYQNPPDARGTFSYTIRDGNNDPVGSGWQVVFNFSACTDIRLCSTQTTGGTVDAAAKTVTATTNSVGVVTLTIVGSGDPAKLPRAVQNCVSVTVGGSGVGWSAKNAAAVDLSNASGCDGADLSAWQGDFVAYAGGAGPYRGRSDYNHDGAVGGGDASILQACFVDRAGGAGTGSVLSCGNITIP